MIIFIHGFGGSGQGNKAMILRKDLANENIIAPTLSYVPDLAIDTLSQLIEQFQKYEDVSLIGSSLGGYYSIYLASKYNLKVVLINPAITPTLTLSNMLGEALNYGDLSKFQWNENHLKMLQKYKVQQPDPKNFLLLTQKGDELLDYKDGVLYLSGAKQIIEEGGNHGFEGLQNHIQTIKSFFQ